MITFSQGGVAKIKSKQFSEFGYRTTCKTERCIRCYQHIHEAEGAAKVLYLSRSLVVKFLPETDRGAQFSFLGVKFG